MSHVRSFVFATALFLGAAHGEWVTWNFVGAEAICHERPLIEALVPCDLHDPVVSTWLHGYLRFDNATAPILPEYPSDYLPTAEFHLPSGVSHIELERLILDGRGMDVRVYGDGDFAYIDSGSFATNRPDISVIWSIYMNGGHPGYFGDRLPEQPPIWGGGEDWVEQDISFLLQVPIGPDEYAFERIGAYLDWVKASDIPEPTTLYLGLGVILISIRRFFGSLALATRKFVVPRPLTVSRLDAMP